jgi:hypothetical protein
MPCSRAQALVSADDPQIVNCTRALPTLIEFAPQAISFANRCFSGLISAAPIGRRHRLCFEKFYLEWFSVG